MEKTGKYENGIKLWAKALLPLILVGILLLVFVRNKL